jgi:putative transposase
MLEPSHKRLSLREQCKLLELHRSGIYYKPRPVKQIDIEMMKLIDMQYTKTPYYGVRRMRAHLASLGYCVNRKRLRSYYLRMGLSAIYPKPNLSKPNKEHKVYPYLLRGLTINRVNQVWSTDITYIPMVNGFMYLCAIIDWHSRYVLSWEISNTLDNDFCIKSLKDALQKYGSPEYFNTDQGSQFTSNDFIKVLLAEPKPIKISMDGKGRALDNIFVERLWRSVKYEYIYLRPPLNGIELFEGMSQYFNHYNNERPHQSLGYKTPHQTYQCLAAA